MDQLVELKAHPAAVRQRPRIRIVLMQKNEGRLLDSWIRYHGRITEFRQIVIVDNGSTDPETLSVLATAEQLGVVVDRSFSSKRDYDNKHTIVFDKIQQAQSGQDADFIFPLDADEFLVTASDDRTVLSDRDSIWAELEKHSSSTSYFKMAGSFYNNPTEPGSYFFYKEPAVFFSHDPISSLDHGNHRASTLSESDPVETRIAVVHFQYKRLEVAKTHAVEKLKNRLDDFHIERLRSYSGHGSHMAKYFYYSSAEYNAIFEKGANTKLPAFEAVIKDSDSSFPYDLFFSTDRYRTHRHEVETHELLEPVLKEGLTLEELLLILKYCKGQDAVAIYRESVLIPFLLKNYVWRVTAVGNNLAKINRIVASFSLNELVTTNRCRLLHVAMGDTDELGYPTGTQEAAYEQRYSIKSPAFLENSTQVVIANGRYRVAILLQCIQLLGTECVYILPNFWTRPHYHVVLPFFDMIDNEGDVVVLRRSSVINEDRRLAVLEMAIHDNR